VGERHNAREKGQSKAEEKKLTGDGRGDWTEGKTVHLLGRCGTRTGGN